MEDLKEEIKEQPLKGRAATLAAYKAANPDTQEEPDDDGLHDFASGRYSELEGKYNELNGANGKLAELVGKDPKLGAVLSMIAGDKPKSLPYAISSVYGKDFLDLEGEAMEEFESGYQENLNRLAESEKEREQAAKNIETYQETLLKYGKDNELSEEQLSEVHQGVMTFADNLLMGIVPTELIDLIYKGLNYDKDVQEAADTGFVEGKNEVIKPKMKEKTGANLPDLGNKTGAGRKKAVVSAKKGGSFYDDMEDVKS